MKWALFLLCAGVWSFDGKAQPLPKASDFQEVGVSEEDSDAASSAGVRKDVKTPTAKENEQVLGGTVRVIRKIHATEVFFKDLKDSYIIPSGSKYSELYKAFTESQKKGHKVTFKANTKTRQVLSLETDTPASATDTAK